MGVPDPPPTWSVQTVRQPGLYSREQLERAVEFALALHLKADRGRFILLEPPDGGAHEAG